jgi:signal transduction histidine kinase
MRTITRRRVPEIDSADHSRRHAGFVELERRSRTALDRRQLFDAASEILMRALGADLVEIVELEGEQLVVRSCAGYLSDLRDHVWMSIHRTPAGLAVSTGEVVMVESVVDDARFDLPPALRESGARSTLAVAIPGRERAHGGLCTHSRSPRAFSSDEQAFLQAFAGIIGLWLAARDPALRDSHREQADFLAVVAHDLRNPLAAVEGSMALLSRARDGEDALARVTRVVPIVRRNVARMESLIADLLDLEALQRGGVDLHIDEYPAAELLHDAYDLMKDIVAARGIDLVVTEPAPGLMACCDRSRVLEVFSNLVGNSVKFTAAGGRIELRADDSEDGILLEVRDSGRGIPATDLQRVFERYQRVQTGVNDRSGVGLGLTIAKAIVEAHGGSIGVESEEGVGSAFRFVLPRHMTASGRFTLHARAAEA